MSVPIPPKLRVSFSTLACPAWTWEEIAEAGGRYGYDGVEIRMLNGETDLLDRPEFNEDALHSNLELLEDAGLEVCGLASSVRFDHLEREEREEQLAIGKLYVDLARRLRAGFVRVFGDVLPSDKEPAARHAVLRNIAAGLDALGEYSDSHAGGVEVLIETHGDFADSRLMLELLMHVRHPRVGVLWDTHHPWRFCGERIAETYRRLGPWVRHTHWKDSVERATGEISEEAAAAKARAQSLMSGHRSGEYVLFGTGEFPAAETLRLLLAGGYKGWFSLEWEKAWHPDLSEPESALPGFPAALNDLLPSR
ncbi:MAG TPA: sugar phosphate isomerase/epimerase [Planctomycetaceae bacterium]|nr:sugar phosphate isomerase/epimerase [Planctomycetaceae bacterium]